MRTLPGDLFSCISFISLSRVFLSISYLVGIMFLQYVLSNIPNHFALLLNLVSLCQIFCQNDWTSSLFGIFSDLTLPPLKSWYTPFGLLKNLQLVNFPSWFFFVFSVSCKLLLTLVLISQFEIKSFLLSVTVLLPKVLSRGFLVFSKSFRFLTVYNSSQLSNSFP